MIRKLLAYGISDFLIDMGSSLGKAYTLLNVFYHKKFRIKRKAIALKHISFFMFYIALVLHTLYLEFRDNFLK